MFHIPQGTAHMQILLCTWKGSRRGSWNSLVLYIVRPSELNDPSTRRLALDFTISCRFSPICTHLTWRNFICQHSAITEAIVKQRPLAFILFDFHCETPGSVGSSKHACHRDTVYPVCSTFYLASCIQVLSICSPTGRVMGLEWV